MPSSVGNNGVTHFLCEASGSLRAQFLPAFPELDGLLQLGAVYHNRKRVFADTTVALGDYVRVHPRPKRFVTAGLDWAARCVFENAEFVVVDKPAGLPVHATVDNAQENLVTAWEAFSGYRPLVTHRLDTVTSGLVLFARTLGFQRTFNRLLAAKRVAKTYVALSEGAPAAGHWVHSMEPGPYAPKVVRAESFEGAIICETVAEPAGSVRPFFQTRLTPLTGRTHQLRVQMAFHGCPILGDALYGGALSETFDGSAIALHAEKLAFRDGRGAEHAFSRPPSWRPTTSA